MTDYVFEKPTHAEYHPWLEDSLFIGWSYTIIITDALSRTTVIQGPATVRFSGEELASMCPPRPQMQRIGIHSYSESLRVIFFNADPGVAEELEEFGRLHHTTSGWYELTVDARYDFGEVLAYLENDCEEVK